MPEGTASPFLLINRFHRSGVDILPKRIRCSPPPPIREDVPLPASATNRREFNESISL